MNASIRFASSIVYNNAFTECQANCPANDTRMIDNNHIDFDVVVDLCVSYRIWPISSCC